MAMKDTLVEYKIILSSGKISPRVKEILKKNPHIKGGIFNATPFIMDKSDNSLKERIYCIIYGINEPVLCKECKTNRVKFLTNGGKSNNTYSTFCSNKCANANQETRQKKKKTFIERFGVENPFSSEEVKEKIRETNLQKYGAENPAQNLILKQKRIQTMLERYGVEYAQQNPEIREKSTKTMLERYGVEHALQNAVLKDKQEKTTEEIYGFRFASSSDEIKEKQRKTYQEKYGVEHPWQDEEVRRKVKLTSKDRYGVEDFNQQHIPLEIMELLNDKDFLYQKHYVEQIPLSKIAEMLGGLDGNTVWKYLYRAGLVTQHYNRSFGEKQINNFINHLGFETQTSLRNIISPYEIDIYIPSHNLAIEYCGLYWHSEQAGKGKNYHKTKLNLCNKNGIRLLTIYEDEWVEKEEIVRDKIMSILGVNNNDRIYARKTFVVDVSKNEKRIFLNKNHIQGDGPGSLTYGLAYDNELVALMTFIKRKDGRFELNRYATSKNVVGGFSKLLKHFQRNNEWKEVISFADLRWSEGNLYEKCGFDLDKTLSPDYYYVVNDKREHKFGFRHKHLKNKLPGYNPNLTEWENCDNAGLLRIWNCGLKKYIMKNTNIKTFHL